MKKLYRLDPNFIAQVQYQFWKAWQASDWRRVRQLRRHNVRIVVENASQFRRAQKLAAMIRYERPFVAEEVVE